MWVGYLEEVNVGEEWYGGVGEVDKGGLEVIVEDVGLIEILVFSRLSRGYSLGVSFGFSF